MGNIESAKFSWLFIFIKVVYNMHKPSYVIGAKYIKVINIILYIVLIVMLVY